MTHNAKTIDNFKKGLVGSGFISDTYDLNEKGKYQKIGGNMLLPQDILLME